MADVHSPRLYFLQVVLPAYEEFGRTLTDGIVGGSRDLIALGRAAEACLHLADHITSDKEFGAMVSGAPRSKKYVLELSARYPCFSIAKDIANSFKHRRLTADLRQLDGIEAIREHWALIRFTDDGGQYYAARKVVVVRLKDGAEMFAEDILGPCIVAWVQELLRLGIIDGPPRIPASPRRWIPRADVPERPRIEMRGEQGEYFESRPMLLSYDQARDMYLPLQGKIGSVQVDIKLVVTPSRFAAGQDR